MQHETEQRQQRPATNAAAVTMRAAATAVLCAAMGAGCAGLSNRVDGTLIDVLNTEDPALIAILVELDEGDIIGSTDVVVTFDPEVLRCIEGRDATREDLRPGIDVRAQRVDSDEVDASDPPAVRAIDVAVRCDD